MLYIAFVQHKTRFRIRGMSSMECDVDVLWPNEIDPGLAAQPVRAVVIENRLIHHVPRVDPAGVMPYDTADVVRHDLPRICAGYVGWKPVRQGIPPDQAMAAKEHAMLFGPGNSPVPIRKIEDLGGGPQILGEL